MAEDRAEGVITIILPCGHDQGIDTIVYNVESKSRTKGITPGGYFVWGDPVIEANDYSETEYLCACCGKYLGWGDDDTLRELLYENTNLNPPEED